MTTVTVGTQVSGIVQDLYADFNSIVKKGHVIARLDPALLETALETAKANLANSQANLERQKVAVADAGAKLTRAKELSARQLITQADLETADVTAKQADGKPSDDRTMKNIENLGLPLGWSSGGPGDQPGDPRSVPALGDWKAWVSKVLGIVLTALARLSHRG